MNEPFNVLFVCTANQGRSAMAELIALDELRSHPGARLSFASAGTSAMAGSPATRSAQDAMAERGLDLGGHRATELSRAVLARADLILVMAREHVGVVLAWERSAGRRTFSLQSFARAIEGQEAGSPEGLVDLANEIGDDRPDDDVADPVGQGRAAHEACAKLLDDVVRPVVAALAKASIGR